MKKYVALVMCLLSLFLSSCSPKWSYQKKPEKKIPTEISNKQPVKRDITKKPVPQKRQANAHVLQSADQVLKAKIIKKYTNLIPKQWGEKVSGVMTQFKTKDKLVALTFDACGGKSGSKFDRKLIDYLVKKQIPATLFINARWIDANYETFMALAKNPLFEIENHGFWHKPLSVTGKGVYGIKGTASPGEVFDEIMLNQRKIEKLTGRKPIYFRSGTAFYDEVAVKIANDTGVQAVSFNVLGDAGATFSVSQIKKACLNAKPGSILIFHMNHPEKHTAEGIAKSIPLLQARGIKFVRLEDVKNTSY